MKNVMFSSPDHHKRWSSAPKLRFTTCNSSIVLNKKWQRRHLPMLLSDFASSRQCGAGPFYHHLLSASSLLASWLGITTWWQTCSQQELHLLKECLKKETQRSRLLHFNLLIKSPFFFFKLLSLLDKLDCIECNLINLPFVYRLFLKKRRRNDRG